MPVYLIRAGETGPVKIGKADDPAVRMRELQCAHYEALALIKVWPGDLAEEAALHQAFSEFRARGEWFRFTPAMLDADPSLLLSQESRVQGKRRAWLASTPGDARDMLTKLGGWAFVARELNLPIQTTYKWWLRNKIASHAVPPIAALAERAGVPEITMDTLKTQLTRRAAPIAQPQPAEAA